MSAASKEATWTGLWIARMVRQFNATNPRYHDFGTTQDYSTNAGKAREVQAKIMADPDALNAVVFYTALQAVVDDTQDLW